ncbi:MAG: TrkA family potassium uptake protein [Actinomycetia bacterium]|nr:TrkA family potassium uptake protein [Actinomycetota bacterium]MCG2789687.1 TrkA family potassium uptake protein [Actinomycetes bacterium]
MNIVIGGCGRVGRYLAHTLESSGHNISIIDKDPANFDELWAGYKGKKVIGIVFDRDVLENAGIKEADVYVAVTSGDNSNIVSARIAKEYFKVPIVFARIYDPRRAEIYKKFGVSTIATVTWASSRLVSLILNPELHSEYVFGSGEVEMVEVTLPLRLENKLVKDLEISGEIKVSAIFRENNVFIPNPGTIFSKDDVLYITVSHDSISKLRNMLGAF